MSRQTLKMTDALHAYLVDTVDEHEALRRLREETAGLEQARMQIAPEQGQLMQLLVRLVGAKRTIEVGTFTGYSALAVALALPPDGRVVACDVSEEWTSIGRRYWAEAGVADRIDLRLAPAVDTLSAMIDAGEAGSYDFAFIDADKANYPTYYERCLTLLRPGGLIAIDNTLWSGRVADAEDQSEDTRAIRAVNRTVASDDRVHSSLVPVADGLHLALKK